MVLVVGCIEQHMLVVHTGTIEYNNRETGLIQMCVFITLNSRIYNRCVMRVMILLNPVKSWKSDCKKIFSAKRGKVNL